MKIPLVFGFSEGEELPLLFMFDLSFRLSYPLKLLLEVLLLLKDIRIFELTVPVMPVPREYAIPDLDPNSYAFC
jgi:hypothetical protein